MNNRRHYSALCTNASCGKLSEGKMTNPILGQQVECVFCGDYAYINSTGPSGPSGPFFKRSGPFIKRSKKSIKRFGKSKKQRLSKKKSLKKKGMKKIKY